MHRFSRPHIRVRQQGQTLIIALIVLGVLLILGLVFLGLIDRNIRNATRSQRRSESSDLAEAGIRYAHSQLVTSLLGADWRGLPTILQGVAGNANATGDPDAYYLRPSSGLTVKDPSDGPTGTRTVADLGGPDLLGSFIRVVSPTGRSLVRIRYGASDALPTRLAPGGPLRNPGAARATLIIESVGRTGVINTSDPTTFNTASPLQFQGFADEATLRAGIGALAQADSQLVTSRRMVAFAPIGIIDAARFETNVFNSSAPIQIGIPSGLGATAYNDVDPTKPNDPLTDVGSNLELQLGTPGATATTNPSLSLPRGFGSFIANGDVELYGNLHVFTNRTLGDTFRVAGRIAPGDAGAKLTITPSVFDSQTTFNYTTQPDVVLTESGANSFDSQSASFNTAKGLVLDGSARTDADGYASGVGLLVPPSTLTVDPQTKLNRYVAMTRESGLALYGQANSGAFGHGGGVYVDNTQDRQEPEDSIGRANVGSARSLFDDWLNPNSGAADSGWEGPFYHPLGAVVQLLPDGFTIQRDALGKDPSASFWKDTTGAVTSTTTIRYRLGMVGTQVYIIDSLTPGIGDINGAGATAPDFTKGVPFNGVLYFEGNVRVRGTIPTGVQMTLVSGATIYIEGSISKGITNNEVTGGTRGDAITTLPTASLMLMAKDNVAVNTPMFFGPTAGQIVETTSDTNGATNISPVVVHAAGGNGAGQLEFNADLGLDTTASLSPSAWKPYAMTYTSWDNNPGLTNNFVPTELLLAQTMADGTASASLVALDVNAGTGGATSTYPFLTLYDPTMSDNEGLWDNVITNTAATYLSINNSTTLPGPINMYGLGGESWQTYAKFETRSFPLVPTRPPDGNYSAGSGLLTQSTPNFGYALFSGLNDLLIHPAAIAGVSTNDLLVGRVAVTPSEVKIEASIFAEQGSFFVIPGPWFNPNPNDTHDPYTENLNTYGKARADRIRLEAYGTAPGAPFYGEPLDVHLSIVGSVAENLPPPIAMQSEWIRKWGWIPRRQGATGVGIPSAHVPTGYAVNNQNFVPNLTIQYDPVLATGRLNDPQHPNLIRQDGFGRPLPPMPRLPVSPKLAYFGEL